MAQRLLLGLIGSDLLVIAAIVLFSGQDQWIVEEGLLRHCRTDIADEELLNTPEKRLACFIFNVKLLLEIDLFLSFAFEDKQCIPIVVVAVTTAVEITARVVAGVVAGIILSEQTPCCCPFMLRHQFRDAVVKITIVYKLLDLCRKFL
jgi:hypothetical protein